MMKPLPMKMTRMKMIRLRLVDLFSPKAIKIWYCLSSLNISETKHRRRVEKNKLILSEVKVIAVSVFKPKYLS